MPIDASFGRWLQQRRKALGLTQAELGRQVGASAAAIRKIEAGERRPSTDIATRLARYLAIPPMKRLGLSALRAVSRSRCRTRRP